MSSTYVKQIPKNPTLLQISARPWMFEQNIQNISKVPDSVLDGFKEQGINILYLMGVWKIGQYGINFDKTDPGHLNKFKNVLPDFVKADIIGSPFAITEYSINPQIGSDEDMKQFKARLHERGMLLLLDFVPNHCAVDSPLVGDHPEYFVRAPFTDGARQLPNGIYFGGDINSAWKDTLQFNLFSPSAVKQRIDDLLKVAQLSDGARCDVAHFSLTEEFEKNWGQKVQKQITSEFWDQAIQTVRKQNPGYLFVAEEYGKSTTQLTQQGFNFCYDKDGLLDTLASRNMDHIRDYIKGARLEVGAHFVENHDEQRAVAKFGSHEIANAAAIISYTLPGMKFLFHGQQEGKQNKLQVQLRRGLAEETHQQTSEFYQKLFQILKNDVFQGEWQYKQVEGWDAWRLVAWTWQKDNQKALIVVNFTDQQGQGAVKLQVEGGTIKFHEMFTGAVYDRNEWEVREKGLYCIIEKFTAQIFFY